MRVKFILPALTEARSAFWRPIKYSLFPPLGCATLAGYLSGDDEAVIADEHVETLDLNDRPDLVALQVYVTSAKRAYAIADHYRRKGVYVVLGGLHVTDLPQEAARHADTIFCGPGEDTWPQFLADFRSGHPQPVYRSRCRDLTGMPPVRRDLIRRELYLVPNSLVVSRGCPHHCDFCYKDAFYAGGKSFYTRTVDQALEEIASLPGRHLFFLDDHLFGHERFARDLFSGMRGMGRVWQAAGTVRSVLNAPLLKAAVDCGLRSLFVGFETLRPENLLSQNKRHNLGEDYQRAVKALHDHGVMINGSFIFGLDEDGPEVFDRTVDWAVENGIETATFHILTPYPGTRLFQRWAQEGRILHTNWDRYDTRHVVFRPARLSPQELEAGYWRAYKKFYSWRAIGQGVMTHPRVGHRVRHLVYAGAWKKCEPFWSMVIRNRKLQRLRPLLEKVLAGGRTRGEPAGAPAGLERLRDDRRWPVFIFNRPGIRNWQDFLSRMFRSFLFAVLPLLLWLSWEAFFDQPLEDPRVSTRLFLTYIIGNFALVLIFFAAIGRVLEQLLNVYLQRALSHRIVKALVFFCALDHFFFWL